MTESTAEPRVVAVVVAWNRRDLLVEVLEGLASQTVPVTEIVVIDNASDDDSAEMARTRAPKADVVTLSHNTGGAGGFAVGAARALAAHAADWLWLMDDDTIPTPTTLEELLRATGGERVVLAGSRVVWTDGQDHPMNTPREKPFVSRSERAAAAFEGTLAVRSSSFVSMLVRADIVRERGLPIADYFIWNDDFEFSTRILRGMRGRYVPTSVVVHKTKKLGATDVDPGERFYYEVRNKLWLLIHSRGLNPGEKVLYFGSTLRRWLRTFLRSENRAVLRRAFGRGLRDGLTSRPRPNSQTLALLGAEIAEAVTADALATRPAATEAATDASTDAPGGGHDVG